MTMRAASAVLAAGFLLSACGGQDFTPPRELSAGEQAVVQSSNLFGLDLFREVIAQSDGGDVFISPLSVSLALGMTYNGAAGQTAEAMAQVLGLDGMDLEQADAAYRSLIDLLVSMDPEVTLEIADSLWLRLGFQALQEFLDAVRAAFDAEVATLDFDDPAAVEAINAWVDEKTHGRIPAILDGPIPAEMVLYLINAVYFKGDWSERFAKADTAQETFHAPGGDRQVAMMHLETDELPYFENDRLQAVELPYGHGYFRMTVVLPRDGVALDELIADLDAETWTAWQAAFEPAEGDLALPRFRLEYKTGLVPVLAALGMEVAFDPDQADFSGINPDEQLYISEVTHKTFVAVDEQGTEAAAVTSVGVGSLSAPNYFSMRVDRPFLFVIHDGHSGALLFMGKMTAPAE